MWESLQPFVEWVGSTTLSQWLGQSTDRIAWLFVMHLFGLTLLLGTTIVLSIRLLGLGLRKQQLAQLSRDLAILRTTGLVLMLISGALIFTGGAVSYFEGPVVPAEDGAAAHRSTLQLYVIPQSHQRRGRTLQSGVESDHSGTCAAALVRCRHVGTRDRLFLGETNANQTLDHHRYRRCLVRALPLFAHHGTSISYEMDKTITVTGTVTEFDFSFPHPSLFFDVKDEKGQVVKWGAEFLPTPPAMRNLGWSKTTVKYGDTVVLGCHPSKSKKPVCAVQGISLNGKVDAVGRRSGGPGRRGQRGQRQ